MPRLHISQDDTGFWQLSLEEDGGQMKLISHQFPSPDHLIQDARELVEDDGELHGAAIVIGAPRPRPQAAFESAPRDYVRPAPRKAIE